MHNALSVCFSRICATPEVSARLQNAQADPQDSALKCVKMADPFSELFQNCACQRTARRQDSALAAGPAEKAAAKRCAEGAMTGAKAA
jgi:hypothetical protein